MLRYLLIIALLYSDFLSAQVSSDNPRIKITGLVTDDENPARQLEDLMIVNLRTQQGSFGNAGGRFNSSVQKDDTLLIASTGYEFKKICFRDSVFKNEYSISIKLKKLSVQLREIQVFSSRDLEAIEKDIQKLGYNKKDYELSGINAIESPITFLYQEFSRRERLKRHNAELVNDEKRRQLLKELLARFVADDIIELSNDDFDHFIDFCNVSEDFMKTSTQYEFMIYIKQKYRFFSNMNDYYPEKKRK
jgi:hypothetical protein